MADPLVLVTDANPGTARWDTISGAVPSALKTIQVAINGALGNQSLSSTTTLPAGCQVFRASLDVSVGFTGGCTIAIGVSGTTAKFMATTDNDATVVGVYFSDQDTTQSTAAAILVTVAGAPVVGTGRATIFYATPAS